MAAAQGYDKAKVIKKNTDGVFSSKNIYRKELVAYLQENQVGTLIITGANGGACVYLSMRGALDNNCTVIAYNRGIADFNFKDFIYPFAGYYDNTELNCKNCSFKEVSSMDGVVSNMINNMRAIEASPVFSKKDKSGR